MSFLVTVPSLLGVVVASLLLWFYYELVTSPAPEPTTGDSVSGEVSTSSEATATSTRVAESASPTLPPEQPPADSVPAETAIVPADTESLQGTPATSATKLEWGTYVGYTPADLEAFESMVGAEVDIRALFVNWYAPFPTTVADHLAAEGKTLLIFWEHHGVSLDSIIAGEQDEYIREFAAAANSHGVDLIIAPLHEMNGNWDPWNGTVGNNTPEKVVLTWQRIFDVFNKAENVRFAWTVNNVSVPDTMENSLENYYPGDAYVDIVGVDGFNFDRPWRTFDEVFGNVLGRLKQYNKPLYILSTATAEGERKADWIYNFGEELIHHPEVRGWVWFHIDKERDWRVNSDPTSLEAFKAIVPR